MNALKELITNSNVDRLLKLSMLGFVTRAAADEKLNREAREMVIEIGREKKINDIVLSSDDLIIYTVYGDGEWEKKYPYRSIFKDEKGIWRQCSTVSQSFDLAFLVYLQNKYLGDNSQFVDFAAKMLEIKIED